MDDVQAAPIEKNRYGHDYSEHYQSPEGYGVCFRCGARENTDRSIETCLPDLIVEMEKAIKAADRLQLRAWHLAMLYRDKENPRSSMVNDTIRACDEYRKAKEPSNE